MLSGQRRLARSLSISASARGAGEMSRSFLEFMRKFEETLSGMRANALLPQETWIGTPEEYRERCAKALDVLSAAWTQDSRDLVKLQQLVKRALEFYAQGEVDAGTFAAKEVDEFLFGVRQRASAARTKQIRRPSSF